MSKYEDFTLLEGNEIVSLQPFKYKGLIASGTVFIINDVFIKDNGDLIFTLSEIGEKVMLSYERFSSIFRDRYPMHETTILEWNEPGS